MSYKCDRCNTVRMGSELKYISKIRNVVYNKVFVKYDKRQNKEIIINDTPYYGIESVTEEKLCENCYAKVKDTEPIVVGKTKYVDFVGIKKKVELNSLNEYNEEAKELNKRGITGKYA